MPVPDNQITKAARELKAVQAKLIIKTATGQVARVGIVYAINDDGLRFILTDLPRRNALFVAWADVLGLTVCP